MKRNISVVSILLALSLFISTVCPALATEIASEGTTSVSAVENAEDVDDETTAERDGSEESEGYGDQDNIENEQLESDQGNSSVGSSYEDADVVTEVATEEISESKESEETEAEQNADVSTDSEIDESSAGVSIAEEIETDEKSVQTEDAAKATSSVAFAGGSGTEKDPYKVSTAAQLDAVRNYPEAYFIQTADINMSSVNNWIPIGKDNDHCFWGSYDGNGHTISNLKIKNDGTEDYVGLFGYAGSAIKNLNLKNVDVEIDMSLVDDSVTIGTLAGDAPIVDCSAQGIINVTGSAKYSEIGGLVGRAQGIENSNSEVLISVNCTGYQEINIGGLAGICLHASILDSYYEGSISVSGNILRVGGIVGQADWYAGIQNCVNYANINSKNESSGSAIAGIAGRIVNDTGEPVSVENCVNFGNIIGSEAAYASGITRSSEITVHNCYDLGSVRGNSYSGRIFTSDSSDVSASGNYAFEGATVNDKKPDGGLLQSGYNGMNMSSGDIQTNISDILNSCGCEWVEPAFTKRGPFSVYDFYGFDNPEETIEKEIFDKYFPESYAYGLHEKFDKVPHGLCYGMALSAMASLAQSSPPVNSYGVNSLYDIEDPENITSSALGMSLLEYIKNAYVLQFTPFITREHIDNTGKMSEMNEAVLNYLNGVTIEPVYVSLSGNYNNKSSTHVVLILGISKDTNSYTVYEVYDCNDPGKKKELILNKEHGEYVSWEYQILSDTLWVGDGDKIKYSVGDQQYFVTLFASNALYESDEYNVLITIDLSNTSLSVSEDWWKENWFYKYEYYLIEPKSNFGQEFDDSIALWYKSTPDGLLLNDVPADAEVTYTTSTDSVTVIPDNDCNISISGSSSLDHINITENYNGEFSISYYKPDEDSDYVDHLTINGVGGNVEVENRDGVLNLTGAKSVQATLESGIENEDGIIQNPTVSSDEYLQIPDGLSIDLSISDSTISVDIHDDTQGNVLASGECGDNLTYKVTGTGDNLTLTISGDGDMYDYANFNPTIPTVYSAGNLPPWVSDADIRARIKRIVVKEGVTGIGAGAFSYVGSPEYGTRARISVISLPSSLRRIGGYAFYYTGCNEITIGSLNNPVKMEYANPKTGQLLKGYGLACSNFKKVNICLDDDYGMDFSRSTVESVVFLNGTESIPGSCFESCEELQNITLAKSVTTIDGRAFSGCHNLARVDIPSNSSLETIGFEAFMNCNNLETITLPENLGIIDSDAFENCTSLESIVIPDSVNAINNSAFKGCTGLRTVKLSAGIKKISYGLFSGCENLEIISIPGSVTEIASVAFQNCKKLTRIVLPASVRNAGVEYSLKENKISAFAGAENLVEIAVDPNNTTYKSYDGCLYNSDRTELLYCPEGKAKIVFAPSTTVFTGSTFRCGEAGTGESKLKELYFGTCSPELFENAFGISKIKGTAYYNNFLNTWPSGKRQNYGGQITWAEKALDMSDCSMTISPSSYTYDGTAKKPAVSLVYSGKNLTYNNVYTISYKNNVNAGKATVTAKGVGSFTGTATKSFTIKAATPVLTGWQTIDGEKYYYDNDGSMHIGWLQLGDKWYYFRTTGVMHTGMLKKDGKYYYLEKSGIRHSGWLQVNGKLYYFKLNGEMLTGWLQVKGKKFYFKTNGQMLTGWLQKNGKKFYFKTNGQMHTGWLKLSGKYYYFKETGQMVTGRYKIGNKWFTFDKNGVRQ